MDDTIFRGKWMNEATGKKKREEDELLLLRG
jgi:hypothetical protein